jgi:phage/plasmid-associated DNA primase
VNPVRAFFEEFVEEKSGCFVQTKFLYEKYKEWAENTGHKVLNDRSFGKQVLLNTKAIRDRRQEGPERFYIYDGINYTTTKADKNDQKTLPY